MTCKEIIAQYLKKNGFDGLATDDCGCRIDDLFPCSSDFSDCQPAHRIESGMLYPGE
jgi:hypothetical protein